MKETLALAITAHLLADFLFQTNWIVQHKRNILVLLLHILIATVTVALAVGHWNHPLLWVVAGSHLAVDLLKTYFLPDKLWSLLLDQALHLAALALGAFFLTDCAQTGLWFQLLPNPTHRGFLLKTMTIAGGVVLCIQTGGVLISQTVKPLLSKEEFQQMKGVPNGGRLIGYLERALVMLLIWIDQPAGIGFLVTAKSILRFGDIKDSEHRQITEYVIIGTFLSFGWAIFVTVLIQKTLQLW